MFRELSNVCTYAWGTMTLVFMYDQLREAIIYQMKQVASYMTLLHAWIYKHFQGVAFGTRELEPDYQEPRPRACRWKLIRGAGLVEPYRHVLDRQTTEEVTWDPYAEHRGQREFQGYMLI